MCDDPAITATAMACRMSCQHVATAVRQDQQGFKHLPGTGYYTAVVAYNAVRIALDAIGAHRSYSAYGAAITDEGEQVGESVLNGA